MKSRNLLALVVAAVVGLFGLVTTQVEHIQRALDAVREGADVVEPVEPIEPLLPYERVVAIDLRIELDADGTYRTSVEDQRIVPGIAPDPGMGSGWHVRYRFADGPNQFHGHRVADPLREEYYPSVEDPAGFPGGAFAADEVDWTVYVPLFEDEEAVAPIHVQVIDEDAQRVFEADMRVDLDLETLEITPVTESFSFVGAGCPVASGLIDALAYRLGHASATQPLADREAFAQFCEVGDHEYTVSCGVIDDAEVASCQAIGREPIGFWLGTGAAVFVVSEASMLRDLTVDELAATLSTYERWVELDPELPDEPISWYLPPANTGAFGQGVGAVLRGEVSALAGRDVITLADPADIGRLVADDPNAIGLVDWGYFAQHSTGIVPVAINDVVPSAETIAGSGSGAYPLRFSVYLYTTAELMSTNPTLNDFVETLTSDLPSLIGESDSGILPPPPPTLFDYEG